MAVPLDNPSRSTCEKGSDKLHLPDERMLRADEMHRKGVNPQTVRQVISEYGLMAVAIRRYGST
jgi:hypothetical protein